jgi:subtilisin family serine protease
MRISNQISILTVWFATLLVLAVMSANGDVNRAGAPDGGMWKSTGSHRGQDSQTYKGTGKKPLRYVANEIVVKYSNGAAEKLRKNLAQGKRVDEAGLGVALDELHQRYRVKKISSVFKDFEAKRKRLEALKSKDNSSLSEKERRRLKRLRRTPQGMKVPDLAGIYKLKVQLDAGVSLEDVVEAYNDNPDVEYAELNYIVSICFTPNDSDYPIQWPLNNTGQDYPESGRYNHPPGTDGCDIDAPEAWDICTGSSDAVVAVVDTGVDYNHRDLQNNMWVNELEANGVAGVDDDGNGYVDDIYGYDFVNRDSDPIDDHGHGSHCSGIIAAQGNNGLDISGVCWDGRIMGLKFMNEYGSGPTSGAMEAIYYAVEEGADVISNSWGGGDYSEAMAEAINYAHSQGVIMVAAAGNDNTDEAFYPSSHEYMISVAATDSNDQKATFSNYGDLVDLAAPGVDILSLRAAGTSRGTVYDGYTTILSGTSMACPHVAGACALLLAVNPTLSCTDVYEILMETSDPIADGICLSDGRINIFNAMLSSAPSAGVVEIKDDFYSCSGTIDIWLADGDLAGGGIEEVTLATSSGDLETVSLTEMITGIGVFSGAISSSSDTVSVEDGTLQMVHNDVITATYQDQNDGTGNPAVATDTATADCESPIISNVEIDPAGPKPEVTFETNEPASVWLLCGQSCSEPNEIVRVRMSPATSHSIELIGVLPETDYFFVVEATDAAGNKTTSPCYPFTTNGPGEVYVPGECDTIQEAIDRSWHGGTVLVADGRYNGTGNRDIDFGGRAITVKSQNGPDNCIIDPNGTETEPHRGFYFHGEEDEESVLDGFTITNGYAYGDFDIRPGGGAIRCDGSSPTIINCMFIGNSAGMDGGAIDNTGSSPTIINCTFTGNAAVGNDGGGMNNIYSSSPTIVDCVFIGNSAMDWGGGIRNIYYSDATIINCTFSENVADEGGAIFNFASAPTITNSMISDNTAWMGGGVYCRDGSEPIITSCTFAGNIADGGRSLYGSGAVITNCILWGGGVEGISEVDGDALISYSDIRGGYSGVYNINVDPFFVDTAGGDYHLKSEGWRWDTQTESWVQDTVTSRCIDAGNPASSPGDEPISVPNDPDNQWGVNLRLNMGAYGGTTEASMAPHSWALLADITNDGVVDLEDFSKQSSDWLVTREEQPGDLNRNGTVDLADLALFIEDWSRMTSWHEN